MNNPGLTPSGDQPFTLAAALMPKVLPRLLLGFLGGSLIAFAAHAELPSPQRVPPPENLAAAAPSRSVPAVAQIYSPLAGPPAAYGRRAWPSAALPATPGLAGNDLSGAVAAGEVVELSDEPVERFAWGGPKPGLFQRLTLYETWLPGGGAAGLEMHETSAFVTGGVPFFRRETPLLFTPGFTARFLGGPDAPDVPARLYDATLEIRHLRQLTERLGMDLAVTPGVFSDFEHSRSGMVRVSGRGIAAWQWRPQTQLVLGVAYFNRGNLKLLPVGGVIWLPSDDWRIEAVAPQPRIARRLWHGADREAWGYLAGEVGGGVWAVDRADGSGDLLTLNDFRLRLGVERMALGGTKLWLETGYVFGRTLSYRSVDQTVDLNDAFLLRAGAAY